MKNDSRLKDDERAKRESGVPGGGKGRKDEIGRSGVYPMSGPHPSTNAEIKGQASWGQGERGAAGYEDHGGSELSFESGQLLGGLNVGPGGEPRARAEEVFGDIDVPHDQWLSFFDSFSRQHMDWQITLEIRDAEGKHVEIKLCRLKGISIDHAHGRENAYIQAGETPQKSLTHVVNSPTHVRFKQSQSGKHEGLEIRAADSTTVIRFRSAMRPEMVDGITN